MEVKIDRNRDGWYLFNEEAGIRVGSITSYPEAVKQAAALGYKHNNCGWRHRLLSWNWHSHSFDRYPGWEIEKDDHPAFVKLEHKRGAEGSDVESHAIASAWDDVASVDFYQRDWTDSGLPYVREGDTYWSGWWFATIAERNRFLEWYYERLVQEKS